MDPRQGLQTAARAVKLVRVANAARKVASRTGEDREAAQRALAALMADARGVPMKIGQFLASRPDSDAFESLVTGIEPHPLSEMSAVLEKQFPDGSGEVFAKVEESEAAASLGQVHKAVLHDGTSVAVKLRYPGIVEAVEAELRLAGLMPGMGPAKKWGFDIDSYKSMLKKNMDRELDYRSEAFRQKSFRDKVTVSGLVVPEVCTELCTEGMLVQHWEQGVPLKSAGTWPVEERLRLGEILAATFFKSLFEVGIVHCDPHMGNLCARKNRLGEPQIVLMDYGCTVEVEQRERLALLKMILGCAERDETEPLACFVELSFDAKKLAPIADVLPALCKILFEPFLQAEPYSTKYWQLSARTSALLGEFRWWFRSAGPARLFLLMRAFSGLVTHLETLKIILPWRRVLYDALSEGLIEEARRFEPKSVAEVTDAVSFKAIAKYLKVSVTENGSQLVQVSMPASQVPELEDLIPEDVVAKIRESSIDLETIIREACDSGILPGELFALESDSRCYRVWLE